MRGGSADADMLRREPERAMQWSNFRSCRLVVQYVAVVLAVISCLQSTSGNLQTNRTSAANLVPLETSTSIRRSVASNSTSDTKENPNKLIGLNTHEASSSSTQQSFFEDALAREKDPMRDANYLIGTISPDSNYFPSDSRLINRFRQPVLMNEYDLRLSSNPFAQAAMSGGGLGQADSSGPQVYEAQTQYPMGGPPGANQLENSFYVNMMGPQAMLMPNEKPPEEAGSSDFPSNQYANPTNEVYSPSIPHGAHQNYMFPGANMSPQEYAKQAYLMGQQQQQQQQFESPSAKARNQKILTNAQIVSLIDELKEFNSRKLKEALSGGASAKAGPKRRKQTDDQQSSKVNRAVSEFARNLKSSRKSQENDSDEDSKKGSNGSNSDDDQDADEESERREDDAKNEDDDDLKKEDLQKLASFIFEQQKENNRLLNARRKGATLDRDDEDGDMRDSLLENTSASNQANEEPQGSVRDSKETPTDNTQLMNLLKKLSTKTNVADDSTSYEDNEKAGDSDDNDRARKRRANEDSGSSASTKSSADEKSPEAPDNSTPLLSLINDNLNRLHAGGSMNEKENSREQRQQSKEDAAWVGRQEAPQLNHRKPQVNKRVGKLEDPNNSREEGEEESEYPRSERMKDLETLRQGLARSREAQMKLSRIPLPLNPLFKEALNNELTKVTDQTIVESSGSDDDSKSEPKASPPSSSSSSRDEPEVGEDTTNSDLSPARAEPDEGGREKTRTVRVQIGDEYPISETVNDRINKLSHNLDRYFNDGFLDKFENNSSLHAKGGGGAANQGAESRLRLQVQPGGRRDAQSKIPADKTKQPSRDVDFDINVAIDGKRDIAEPAEEAEDAEEEADEGAAPGRVRPTTGSKRWARKEKAANSAASAAGGGAKVKRTRRQNKEAPRLVHQEPFRRRLAAKKKKKRTTTTTKDPVDSETLDTPIGPDERKLGGVEKSAGSKEERSRRSNSSRRGEKFFQEPD